MREMVEFTRKTRFICHYVAQEVLAQNFRALPAYFQCEIDPDNPNTFSPSGEFVYFSQASDDGFPNSQIHGWTRISDIVIDEILKVADENGSFEEAA